LSVSAATRADGLAVCHHTAMEERSAGLVACAIVFLFVWKWVWPSLTKTLEGRQSAITGQMEQAEAARVEAEKLLADYQAQLAEAKAAANRIRDEGRGQADQKKADLVAKA